MLRIVIKWRTTVTDDDDKLVNYICHYRLHKSYYEYVHNNNDDDDNDNNNNNNNNYYYYYCTVKNVDVSC